MGYVGMNIDSHFGIDAGQILMHRDSLELYCVYDIWEDSRGVVMEIRNLASKDDSTEIIRADLRDYILGGCA